MRCAVISKGLSISELQSEVQKCGGKNIKVASVSKQIFCDLEPPAADKLKAIPGLSVKEIKRVVQTPEAQQRFASPPVVPRSYLDMPIYASSLASTAGGFYQFRELVTPPITGSLTTICILDTGIRKTHEGLRDKVVYEANFSDSPTCEDIFNHGTGVAFCAAGGRHAAGEESGGAPGAYLWNIKVLGDDGCATDEQCVLAIEHCIEMRKEAINQGVPDTDPMFPNQINMSWGEPDDGDPDHPIRVACRAAFDNDFSTFAAAGNYGPEPTTITNPATDPSVCAVGAATFYPTDVWDYSSRGPTKEGIVKPDLIFFGVRVLTASCEADDAFVIKSGTSFSSPFFAGMLACGAEALWRMFGFGGLPGEEAVMKYSREFAEMTIPGVPLTVKPVGTPSEKDNAYGLGLPLGTLWSQAFVPTMNIESIMANLTPIIGVGMLGMMTAAMLKGLK